VGRAVVASTLTTVCVCVPGLFVEGVAAALFRDMAIVVSVALVASLFASLTLIPMLSARWGVTGGVEGRDGEPGTWLSGPVRALRAGAALVGSALALPFRPLGAATVGGARRGVAAYESLLRAALRHRGLTLVLATAVVASAALVAPRLGVELLPEMSQGEGRADLRVPVGTPLEVTAARVADLERRFLADPEVVAVASTVGQSLSRPGLPAEEREHLANLSVRLRDGVLGDAEDAVVDRLQAMVAAMPALEARFERPALFSFTAPVEIELRGRDHAQLEEAARQLAAALSRLPQLAAVTSGARGGNPELAVVFDRERLADLGVTVAAAGQALRDQVLGSVATDLQRGERDVDLRVRASDDVRRDAERLADLPVALRDGQPVPLRAVADVRVARGPAEIARRDHERVAVVTGRPRSTDLGAVLPAVQAVLDATALPTGVHATLSGKVAELGRSLDGLVLAVALATFLVYLVMASQFESFLQPFVILFSVPFAIVGALLALWLLRLPLSVVAGIGFVMLAGIVVNNAIVLVDRVNQHVEAGLPAVEALVAAGRDRLRPILMTTATTVLGLLPMALSHDEGAELRIPLAVTVIGGLTLSTLLTLVLIPVLLSFTRLRRA